MPTSNVLNVTVNPQPTGLTLVTTFEAEAICLGQSATLTASMTPISSASYSIDNNLWQTTPEFNVSPPSDETYTLYVQTSAGCTASLPNAVTMVVNPLPTNLTLAASPTVICAGQSSTLTAKANFGVEYSLNGGNWQTSSTFSVSPGANASYTLRAKTSAGCTATLPNAAPVTVNKVPTNLTFTAAPAAICRGQSSTLTASATDGYQYSRNNSTWQTTTTFSVAPTANASYTLYVRTAAGCSASITNVAPVRVNQLPGTPTGASANSRCGSGTVTFSASATGNTIDWYTLASGGSTVTGGYNVLSFSPSIDASTTYYAQARNSSGCVSAARLPVGAMIDTQQSGHDEAISACGCASGTIPCSESGLCRTNSYYNTPDGECYGCTMGWSQRHEPCGTVIDETWNQVYMESCWYEGCQSLYSSTCRSNESGGSAPTTNACAGDCSNIADGVGAKYFSYIYYSYGTCLCYYCEN
jgi:hypothetical protein